MAVLIRNAPPSKPGRSLSSNSVVRKVAVLGAHSASLVDAPWDDPSWELHGHASSRAWFRKELDFYYDLHPQSCWSRGGRKTAHYPKWLKSNTVPIYMQRHYEEVPASIAYPKRRILQEFGEPHRYFANHVAWIIALALSEGVRVFGLWGINYGIKSEYHIQRGSCEYWIGRAEGMGARVILPEQCTLLREPRGLYGYESHDEVTGKRLPEYMEKVWTPQENIQPVEPGKPVPQKVEPTPEVAEEIRLEDVEYPRPGWSFRPLHDRTDGGLPNG